MRKPRKNNFFRVSGDMSGRDDVPGLSKTRRYTRGYLNGYPFFAIYARGCLGVTRLGKRVYPAGYPGDFVTGCSSTADLGICSVPKCKEHIDVFLIYKRLLYMGTEWYAVKRTIEISHAACQDACRTFRSKCYCCRSHS